MKISGHLWTVAAALPRLASKPRGRMWQAFVKEQGRDPLRLSGKLFLPRTSGARPHGCVAVLHGLGGTIDSAYIAPAVQAALGAGLSCLTLNHRGADGLVGDIYNAGLVEDIAAALASPEVAAYRDIYLLGFSLGGHMALRFAALDLEPRLRAVAAICAPLQLDATASAIDAPGGWAYRHWMLTSLKKTYRAAHRRNPSLGLPPAEADAIGRIWDWDERIVAPRFNFASAFDYYRQMSVAPLLRRMTTPSLLIATRGDPMVPPQTLLPSLQQVARCVDVRWLERGGHVRVPSDLSLGESGSPGLEAQVVQWLLRQPRADEGRLQRRQGQAAVGDQRMAGDEAASLGGQQ